MKWLQFAFGLALGGVLVARAADLRAGAAVVEITPELGTPIAGYYSERGADGVHDPLNAKVIVLESGGTKAALVSLDLISTLRETVEEARRLIESETGIPGRNVMISATHSHTGPTLAGTRRFDALGGTHEKAVRFTEELPKKIAAAVAEAAKNLQAAEARYGSREEHRLAFNRRFHMRDGSVGWNPGKLNPNIVRVAGPTDPEVQVVYFSGGKNDAIATYVNFPIHLDTTGGTHFSADFPFALSESLARAKSAEMMTMFTMGCSGDVNHIDVSSRAPQKGPQEAARIGTILAANVLRTFETLRTNQGSGLRVSSEMVELPIPPVTDDEVAEARKIAERVAARSQPAPRFMDQVKAFKVLDVHARAGKPHEVEVQVIALGEEIAWVSLPGEIFVELGLSIKAGSPFKQTIIASLANGSVGYIPTVRGYSEGNYEAISSRCAPGSGELLVASAIRQLRQLRRGLND